MDKLTDQGDNQALIECGKTLSQYCTSWARKRNVNATGARLCANQFADHPVDRDNDVLLELLKHQDRRVRSAATKTLERRSLSPTVKQRLKRFSDYEADPKLKRRLETLQR